MLQNAAHKQSGHLTPHVFICIAETFGNRVALLSGSLLLSHSERKLSWERPCTCTIRLP